MQLASSPGSGFTLIELVITVAVLGILLALGLPSFMDWIQNAQIRTGAEAILDGLQLARAEAVKRNGWVQLTLTSPNTAGAATAWQVNVVTPPSPAGGTPCPLGPPLTVNPIDGTAMDPLIRSRSGSEGATNAGIAISPAGTTTVTFDPLGKSNSGSTACNNMQQINVTSAVVNDASVGPLEIRITPGGGMRLCAPKLGDPNDLNPPPNIDHWQNLPDNDPRSCWIH